MSVKFPIIELFDRLAIAQVKWEHTKSNHEELEWYTVQASNFNFDSINDSFEELKKIHHSIWDLEWQLKTGVEDQLSLEEIGRRAVVIRDYNNKRIAIKNLIAEKLGCVIKEIKRDHLSEN
jgi:hypothetical protein